MVLGSGDAVAGSALPLSFPVPVSSQVPKLTQLFACLTRLTCDCRDFCFSHFICFCSCRKLLVLLGGFISLEAVTCFLLVIPGS